MLTAPPMLSLSPPGTLIASLAEDTMAVQAAINQNLGFFIRCIVTFGASWVVALAVGYDMTLLMMGTLPLLAAMGYILTQLTARMATRMQIAYSQVLGGP
jgi:ABC-type multidrug transport system fused ATPase/permease subunit